MPEQLVFDDSLNLLGVGLGVTNLTGTVGITYGSPNVVTGSLSVTAAGTISAQTFTSLTVTQTGTDTTTGMPIYTLTGSNLLTSISVTYTGQDPTTNNATLSVAGIPAATGSGSVTSTTVCFAGGTRILTTRGDVAVEDLEVGDLALTLSGAARPIRWLSQRSVDCRRHPKPLEVMPVRIAAHAFGDNRPERDLMVSPGHSICVDIVGEVFIPAASLVNGSTIQQIEVDEITYWHVELDSHDVILAENLPAESYLDMGNRAFFQAADVVDLAVGPDADPSQRTHADFCRPFHAAGPLVDAVKVQLRKRAEDSGWTLSHDCDLHLVVDGLRLEPVVRGLTARFLVPGGSKDVWLVSPTTRPSDIWDSKDARDLGLYLAGLRIEDGLSEARDVPIDHPMLCIGFHGVEAGSHRWTSGRARLPEALWEGCQDGFYLRVELGGAPVPRWVLPMKERPTETRPALALVA